MHVWKEAQDVIAELLTMNVLLPHRSNNEYAREYYEKRVADAMGPDDDEG